MRTVTCLLLTVISVEAKGWQDLLDPELSAWRVWVGVPHKAQPVKGFEARENVKEEGGPAIGFHRTLQGIFKMQEEEGEPVLRVSGEIFGSLETRKDFADYHFSCEFRWGEKRWEPRLQKRRNSGILYHGQGTKHSVWNAWLPSLQYEIFEGGCGDYLSMGPVRAMCPSVRGEEGKYVFHPEGPLRPFAWGKPYLIGECHRKETLEMARGKWNKLEIYCLGKKNIHLLNDQVVMRVQSPALRVKGQWVPINSGKIQIQSEGAELFFKDVKIRPITAFPKAISREAGLEVK